MNALSWVFVVFLTIPVLADTTAQVQESDSVLREDFNDLSHWKPLSFQKINDRSEYKISLEGNNGVLSTRSRASASGIVFKKSFNTVSHPILRWRWKVDNIYKGANPSTKQGDDYPLRIYVNFEYDPAKAGIVLWAKYRLAKMMYGQYPPIACLNYVWASQPFQEKMFDSPSTDRTKMIPLRSGKEQLGKWVEEEVNIVSDYWRAFGEAPPARASLAIMNDSDNTGQTSVSHMDFIEIRSTAFADGQHNNQSKQ